MPGRRPSRVVGLAALVAGVALLSIAVDSEIDVPEWANVPGIDLPFIGDDPLQCDVAMSDGPVVEVMLSGASGEIESYRYLYVNGHLAPELPIRGGTVSVGLPADGEAVFLSVAANREGEDRFWCGSADAIRGVTEA